MSEIAFLMASAFHCNYIPSLLAEHNYNYPVYGPSAGLFKDEEASRCVEKLLADGVRVFVAAGRYPELMLKKHGIPLIALEYSVIGFAKAVRAAKRFSKNVGFFLRYGRGYDMALRYKAAFGDSIIVGGYEGEQDSPKALEYLKTHHVEVLVCGGRGQTLAEKNGYHFEYVQVLFEDGDVLRCVQEAERILKYIHQSDKRARVMNLMHNNVAAGFIAVDNDGNILDINEEALKIVRLEYRRLVGAALKDTPLAGLGAMMEAGAQEEPVELVSLGQQTVAVKLRRAAEKKQAGITVFTMIAVEQLQELERRVRAKITENSRPYTPLVQRLMETNEQYRQLGRQAALCGKTESPVLITGPFGSGREAFARHIHAAGRRCDAPFVAVNCAALPPELPEAQLFGRAVPSAGDPAGVEPGAAMMAAGGTLYLENVEALPLRLQAQLQTMLNSGELHLAGSNRTLPADIRILVSATDSLLPAVQGGSFRADLYYQLAVLQLILPPLSENPAAVSELLTHCLAEKAAGLGLAEPALTPEARAYLCRLKYPGNIPQVANMAERLVVLCEGQPIDLLMARRCSDALPELQGESGDAHEIREAQLLRETLAGCGGSRAVTAQRLGMSTATLWRKMKKYGLV